MSSLSVSWLRVLDFQKLKKTCIKSSFNLLKADNIFQLNYSQNVFAIGANLKGVDMEGSQMTGINLRVATLKNAKLKNCNLRGATLAGTDLEVSSQQ